METETAVRSIVLTDPDITKEMVEQALDILKGRGVQVEMIHNVRFNDARDILKVSRRTLRHYLDSGYLDRVYGGGRRAIGVSRESLFRFMNRRVAIHRNAKGEVESVKRGIAPETQGRYWTCHEPVLGKVAEA